MATVYVSTGSGDDSRSLATAFSPTTPWKTIGKAVEEASDFFDSFSTVLSCSIMSGNYYEGIDAVAHDWNNIDISTYGDGNVTLQSNASTSAPGSSITVETTLITGNNWFIRANHDLIIKPPHDPAGGTVGDLTGYCLRAGNSSSDHKDYVLNVTGVIFMPDLSRHSIDTNTAHAGALWAHSAYISADSDKYPHYTIGVRSLGVTSLKGCVFAYLTGYNRASSLEGVVYMSRPDTYSLAQTMSIENCLWWRCGMSASTATTATQNNNYPRMLYTNDLGVAVNIRNNTITQCTGTWMMDLNGTMHALIYNNLVYNNALSGANTNGQGIDGGNGGLKYDDNLQFHTGSANNVYNLHRVNAHTDYSYNYKIYAQGVSFVPPNNLNTAITNFVTASELTGAYSAHGAAGGRALSEGKASLNRFAEIIIDGKSGGALPYTIEMPIATYPGKRWGDAVQPVTNMIVGTASFAGGDDSTVNYVFATGIGGSQTHTGTLVTDDLLNHSRSLEVYNENQSCTIGCFESIYQFGIPPKENEQKDVLPGSIVINTHNRYASEHPRNTRGIPFGLNIKGPPSLRNRSSAYTVEITPDKTK